MSLLLDTHVMLCWPTDDETLAEEVKDRLDHEHNVSISPATIWEVAIKQSLGKLQPADLSPATPTSTSTTSTSSRSDRAERAPATRGAARDQSTPLRV
ncbi:type II toxin-antitoxin system VapC family toxin [Dactylosporangium aurantiacum]|uniref:type II toxin-antitoxin system VapC family toxin n=1 Tax=Dactylosporangium aurantiacum TaxID=35754 RepID=UPI0021B1E183|nr:hypothetical protein [Dactylosporangium aurantiacum]MDG6108352.1 hypothetical protein [Dactylosporangium aurantiacum]